MGFDGFHEAFDKVRSQFFWAKERVKQRYHMVRWKHIFSPKEAGDLGIINSKFMNMCFIAKWVWKILTDQWGAWLDIIRKKYLSSV